MLNPTVNSRIQGLLRLLSDFQVLFKADLIFKDFSRKPSKFKYFSRLCKPCVNSFCSKKMLVIRTGIHKMLARIANSQNAVVMPQAPNFSTVADTAGSENTLEPALLITIMALVATKPVFWVSHKQRLKPVSSATQTS